MKILCLHPFFFSEIARCFKNNVYFYALFAPYMRCNL